MNMIRGLAILVLFLGVVAVVIGGVFVGQGLSKDAQLKEAMRAEHVNLGAETRVTVQFLEIHYECPVHNTVYLAYPGSVQDVFELGNSTADEVELVLPWLILLQCPVWWWGDIHRDNILDLFVLQHMKNRLPPEHPAAAQNHDIHLIASLI